jgi:O-antigen/teichoic acid export membrane protein
MITGFISAKVVAIQILTPGIALLGQLNNFVLIFQVISSGGINNGVTKYVAQNADSEKEYGAFVATAVRITTLIASACGLVLIFGAGYFSTTLLKDTKYKAVFYIFGFTIILFALNGLLLSIINGFREFKKYVTINITSSIAGLVFAIVLTLSLDVFGSLIALVTYQSVVFIVTLTLVYRSPWFKWELFFGKFNKAAAIKLGQYTKMALASAIAVPLSQLIVRNFLMKKSFHEAGLWSGMTNISNMYLMVITASLSVYYLPKLSGLKTDRDIRHEVKAVYKLLLPFLLVVSFLIYLFRNLIIRILFTHEFLPMQDLFAFQLIGDILKMSTWVLGYILIAKAMTKTYILVELISCTLFTLLSIVFINFFGTIGATMGYAAGFLCQLIMMIFIFRKLLFSHER